MPFRTIPDTTEEYALLSYDGEGKERTDDPDGIGGLLSSAITSRARNHPPTHVFLFIHGWQGDVQAARDQYDRWIKAMLDRSSDQAAMPKPFKPMWIGLHWPSLPFGDEELGGADFEAGEGTLSPQQLRSIYIERLGLDTSTTRDLDVLINAHRKDAAATELPVEARDAYGRIAVSIGYQAGSPGRAPDAEGAPFDPDQAFQRGLDASAGENFAGGGILGGILAPLRQLSYWKMKQRARTIGEGGMHQFVAHLMEAAPNARFHLMGHSFGTIVVSGILGGPGSTQPLPRLVDSVALIQGAVSLWAFGDSVKGKPPQGYFHPWVQRPAVRGPVLVSRSAFDRAVGLLYPWASAVSFSDGSFDVDEQDLPLYGAIGKYGIRALANAVFLEMLDANAPYGFKPGTVYNLESSKFIRHGGGVSGAHSDIAGPEVAHAMWQAALV
jgi:hypothetical protein